MKTYKIESDANYIEIYVSTDCWVGRTLPNLGKDLNEFHFLPANAYSLIAVIDGRHPPLITTPLVGYLLYRPKMLELVFPDNKEVRVITWRTGDMQGWCKDTLPWVKVGKPNTSTRGNAW